ncbi:glycosyltransferase family 2 protein [Pedobacter hiemivivus]|uniref:Glycosyltransferase family 2 protein n=2 Tax=Pedobacter hiemivivus TaxID=2530454 RepID=A0A4R0N897_9SPHI|nr:glycosyltransferase family 2 protein [Pedobacter hiemivivus]
MCKISASIVLYHNFDKARLALDSILESKLNIKIMLIDNSSQILADKPLDCRVEYVFTGQNLGFGAGHNIAIKDAIKGGYDYHFVVNPDVYFNPGVIEEMIKYMADHSDVGMMMPKILNEDGSIQHLPKLLPHPFWILRRKLKKLDRRYKKFVDMYEFRNVPEDKIYNAPVLSGCFSLLNLEAIKQVGAYDDTFFMYFEDFDLSRRIHKEYKTLYFPEVFIFHGYESGANKSLKLLKIFLKSMVVYFNKWGWCFDEERKQANKKTLSQF